MKEMPTLQTERLVLRPFAPADASDVQRLAGERAIAANTLTMPHPYEDGLAEEWIEGHAERWQAGETLNLALERKEDGALIGAVGLDLHPNHDRGEIGYWVGVPYWNHGYCTEAAAAVVRYGFEELGLNRVHAHHFARNPASGRVMQKIGLRHEGVLRRHYKRWDSYEDAVVYGLLREEWGLVAGPGAYSQPGGDAAKEV